MSMFTGMDVAYLYALAFWALIGYWAATIPGLTGENGWAFAQPWYILVPILTVWYGTWFLLGTFIWRMIV